MARYKNITGVETVEQVFTQLPRKNAEKIAIALNQGGDEIATRARTLVPVDDGELKSSIEVRRSDIKVRKDRGSVFVAVVAGTTRGTADYARVVEFGRRPGPDGHPGFAGRDFFFSAYWSVRKRVKDRVKRALRAAAKAVANGG